MNGCTQISLVFKNFIRKNLAATPPSSPPIVINGAGGADKLKHVPGWLSVQISYVCYVFGLFGLHIYFVQAH